MIPTSDAFKEISSSPHTAISKMEVYYNDALVAVLFPHEGQVDTDRNAAIIRTFDCKLSDPDGTLTPHGIRDLLAPFGTVVKLYRGLKTPQLISVIRLDTSDADWNTGTLMFTRAEFGDLIIQ